MANNETIEPEVVTTDLNALAVITTAECDQQVATAKRFPRSIKAFLQEAMELVTLSEEIAGDCIFALPRGKGDDGKKKFIEGPSVRFSEIIACSYGNNRSGSRPMGEDDKFVTAQGVFHDLEKNVAITVEVRRGITDKYGKRYKTDMVGVTANAACAIAVRNARLQGIPKAIWQQLYDAAKKTAIGDAKTLSKKRNDMMAYFQKMNVSPETIYEFMGVKGLEDIGLDELTILKGIATAIKEGTVSIDKAFTTETAEVKEKVKERFNNAQPSTVHTEEETPYAGEQEISPEELERLRLEEIAQFGTDQEKEEAGLFDQGK